MSESRQCKQVAQRTGLKSLLLIVLCCHVNLLSVIVCNTAAKILYSRVNALHHIK